MRYPRVFVEGKEVDKSEAFKGKGPSSADVLIVCGQGVYENGIYYGEYHDRDVYFDHAIQFPEIVKRFNFNTVVLSGGFTQSRAPWLSEAESFLRILHDANVSAPHVPLILDECALDSAENLLFGLMTARLSLGTAPIRRVGIWAAWKFKKWRFNRNAEALGIVEQTYVYSFAPSSDTNIQVPPDVHTRKTFDQYEQDNKENSLLRAENFKVKREGRWQNNRIDPDRDASITALVRGAADSWLRSVPQDGTPQTSFDGHLCSQYLNRFAPFAQFKEVFDCLEKMESGKSADEVGLKTVWQKIMTP